MSSQHRTAAALIPEKTADPYVQRDGWVSWRRPGMHEKICPTGIRSPEHPARSESLYRLRYNEDRNRSTNGPTSDTLTMLMKTTA